MTAHDRAVASFRVAHGSEPVFAARAPGRVNLIGEHTDYNDGFVLPMALPFDTVIAAAPAVGSTVRIHSDGFGDASFELGSDPAATVSWARYIHGMAHVLADEGHPVQAIVATIATDIPAGASLSSSAALEVAAGLALTHPAGADVDPGTLARLGQRVENEIFGLPSGIMDQLASAASVDGHAALIDCRDLSVQAAALPAGTTVVVMDTGTRRELVDSEYADRQATCARVAADLGVAALRDATVADLARIDDPLARRRAHHVITENARTLAAADAMGAGDAEQLGALMAQSHASLRDDYEVSGPALDRIVDIASATPGCLGARMTGGGFAGGAVALVESAAVDAFCAAVLDAYEAPAEQPARAPAAMYPVLAGPGASVADLEPASA